jgi:hypothetical protein
MNHVRALGWCTLDPRGYVPPPHPDRYDSINGTYEVLARAANLRIARGAYREAALMYPEDKILLWGSMGNWPLGSRLPTPSGRRK